MNNPIRHLALAAALLLGTTLATQAASPTDHWKRPAIDTTTTQGIGTVASPGDAFYPDRGEHPGRLDQGFPDKIDIGSGPSVKPDWTAVCKTSIQPGMVLLINKGNTTWPKGAKMVIVLAPTGEEVVVEVPANIPPGTAFEAGQFEGLDIENHPDCRAGIIQI